MGSWIPMGTPAAKHPIWMGLRSSNRSIAPKLGEPWGNILVDEYVNLDVTLQTPDDDIGSDPIEVTVDVTNLTPQSWSGLAAGGVTLVQDPSDLISVRPCRLSRETLREKRADQACQYARHTHRHRHSRTGHTGPASALSLPVESGKLPGRP
ncbi:MAG: hypothetical protein GY703_21920 [Gammaproteobacteria bacterium]|nr:hypothetical protein [Gammaproteobacteria bacterium]